MPAAAARPVALAGPHLTPGVPAVGSPRALAALFRGVTRPGALSASVSGALARNLLTDDEVAGWWGSPRGLAYRTRWGDPAVLGAGCADDELAHLIGRYLDGWAHLDEHGQALRLAALGRRDVAAVLGTGFDAHSRAARSLRAAAAGSWPLAHGIVRAAHASTQDALAAAGLRTVTLYRGQHANTRSRLPRTGEAIRFPPLSSWTTSAAAATRFAQYRGPRWPVLLAMTVPADRVASTPMTGFGCLGERELVLLGGCPDATTVTVLPRRR
jgi:hypothetical protein